VQSWTAAERDTRNALDMLEDLVAVDRHHAGPSAGLADPPAAALALVDAAQRAQELASVLLTAAAVVARERGVTWQAIGDQLGTTRQAAHERFQGAYDDYPQHDAYARALARRERVERP
jgi:hypothetical protein